MFLQELHCLLQCLMIIVVRSLKSIPSFVLIGYCVHGHMCPYSNIWPEDIYCCFTRTTLFIEMFTCLYDQS